MIIKNPCTQGILSLVTAKQINISLPGSTKLLRSVGSTAPLPAFGDCTAVCWAARGTNVCGSSKGHIEKYISNQTFINPCPSSSKGHGQTSDDLQQLQPPDWVANHLKTTPDFPQGFSLLVSLPDTLGSSVTLFGQAAACYLLLLETFLTKPSAVLSSALLHL